ncbi:MAG TPA: hypothetical protein VEA59_03400 [Patescibacteria group bacterium]|nr:hypothetical protein [Patescibacteria group bacterium]
MERRCAGCDKEITACNGFSHAGDTMLLWNGLLGQRMVRELCARCAEVYAINLFGWEAAGWPHAPTKPPVCLRNGNEVNLLAVMA